MFRFRCPFPYFFYEGMRVWGSMTGRIPGSVFIGEMGKSRIFMGADLRNSKSLATDFCVSMEDNGFLLPGVGSVVFGEECHL
jgi:hypothetical protein